MGLPMELMQKPVDENASAMVKCKHSTRKRIYEPESLASEG